MTSKNKRRPGPPSPTMLIVKVQVCLFTTEEKRQVIVYDESRRHFWKGDVFAELVEAMGEDIRAFFESHIQDDGKLMLDKKIGEQGW